MKLLSLSTALAVAFPSFAVATLWPVPQSMELGQTELELDVWEYPTYILF